MSPSYWRRNVDIIEESWISSICALRKDCHIASGMLCKWMRTNIRTSCCREPDKEEDRKIDWHHLRRLSGNGIMGLTSIEADRHDQFVTGAVWHLLHRSRVSSELDCVFISLWSLSIGSLVETVTNKLYKFIKILTYCPPLRHLADSRSVEGSSSCRNVNNNLDIKAVFFSLTY